MQPSAHLIDYERRFGGVARLYGREGAEAIAKTPFLRCRGGRRRLLGG